MIISRSILLCGLLYVVGTLASVLDARAQVEATPIDDVHPLAKRQNLPTPTEGAGYLPSPLAQPSIGGGAGTFNVVSLSRSSSFNFDQAGGVSQTTTFQAPAPQFSSQDAVAASYATGDSGSNNTAARQQAASTSALPSLTGTSTASVIASGSGNAAAPRAIMGTGAAAAWPVVAVVGAAVVGAGWVL